MQDYPDLFVANTSFEFEITIYFFAKAIILKIRFTIVNLNSGKKTGGVDVDIHKKKILMIALKRSHVTRIIIFVVNYFLEDF